MSEKDFQEIKHVVDEAYIKGVHEEQNRALIDKGFHPDFKMLVLDNNDVTKVSVDEWLARIEAMKEANPDLWAGTTTYDLKLVNVARTAAVIKLEVNKGGNFFSSDYMLLYKIEGKWQIVSKIFSV
ncbi:MAG: nuclear transport factor 2 family protein [Candidatus Thorarchaeota archaeon]|jgi:hypothetical protein